MSDNLIVFDQDKLLKLLTRIIGAVNPDNSPDVKNERAEEAKVLCLELSRELKQARIDAEKKKQRRIRAEERREEYLADALHDPYYGTD